MFSWTGYKNLQPVEWLQCVAGEFFELAESWDDWDSDFCEDRVEEYQDEEPEMSTLEIYSEISHTIGESLMSVYVCDTGRTADEIEQLREPIIKAFENNIIFQNLLNAIGIIESVMNEANEMENDFCYHLRYTPLLPVTPTPEDIEQIIERYGAPAAKVFREKREERKLTEGDYENAFSSLTAFLAIIERRRFSEKLRESAYAIQGYCKLKAKSPEEYEKTKTEIAKKRGKWKLNEKVGNILKSSPDMKAKDIAELLNKTWAGKFTDTSPDSVRKTNSWKNRLKKKQKASAGKGDSDDTV